MPFARKLAADTEVLEHMMRFTEKHGYQPSYRTLCLQFGVSPNCIRNFMYRVQYHGYIKMTGGGRSVEFLKWPCGVKFRGFRDSRYTPHENNLIWGVQR